MTTEHPAKNQSPSRRLHDHPHVKAVAEQSDSSGSVFATMLRMANEARAGLGGDQRQDSSPRVIEFSLKNAKRIIPAEHAQRSVAFTDITRYVDGPIKNQDMTDRIEDGIAVVSVTSPHHRNPPSRITFMEYEDGTAQDLNNTLEKLALKVYNNTNGQGLEHFKALFFKPYLAIPFQEVTITPGTWGRLIYMGCDEKTHQDDSIRVELIPGKLSIFEIRDKKELELAQSKKLGLWAVDMTDRVEKIARESEHREGDILLFTPHTTGGIMPINGGGIKRVKNTLREFAIANEEINHVVRTMARQNPTDKQLQELAKQDVRFWHDYTVGDANGISHLQAVFIGPQFAVHYKDGVPELGNHRLYYVDTDVASARPRKVVVVKYNSDLEGERRKVVDTPIENESLLRTDAATNNGSSQK
jgi:thiamine phosphate synthase YjbQ (UPF0047 family)